MRMFCSRINRGIVLGILILISVSAWIFCSTVQFNRQLDTIKIFIDEYVSALESLNMIIATGSESEMRSHVDGFLSDFFVAHDGDPSIQLMSDKDWLAQQLEELMHPATGRIASVSFTIEEIHTIQQVASNAAEVSFAISTEGITHDVTSVFDGSMRDFPRMFDGSMNNWPPFNRGQDADMAPGWRGGGNLDALLYKNDGEWGIVSIHGLVQLTLLGRRPVSHG